MLICQWKPAYTSVTTNNAQTVWTCFHSLQKLVFLFSLVFLRSYFSQKSVQVGFWTASRRRKNWLSEYHRVCYRWSGQWWGPCALWPRFLYPERLRTGADLQIRLEWRMGWSGGKKQIHESQGELLIRCFQVFKDRKSGEPLSSKNLLECLPSDITMFPSAREQQYPPQKFVWLVTRPNV